MTPPEFGALDEDVRRFYRNAWNEKQRRIQDSIDDRDGGDLLGSGF